MLRAPVALLAFAGVVGCGNEAFSSGDASTDGAIAPDGSDAGGADAAADSPTDSSASDGGCSVPKAPAMGACTNNASACAKQLLATATDLDGGTDRYLFGMAVDSTHVYWAAQDNHDGQGVGRIRRATKTPGVADTIATQQQGPMGLVLDDTFVYWVNQGRLGGDPTIQRLRKDTMACNPTCATPELIYTGKYGAQPLDHLLLAAPGVLFVLGGSTTFLRLESASPLWRAGGALQNQAYGAFTSDNRFVYWASGLQSRMRRITSDGINDELFANFPDPTDAGNVGANYLTVDCTDVYARGGNQVVRFPKAAPVPSLVGTTAPGVYAMTMDDTFIYLGHDGGSLTRLRKDGSKAEEVVIGSTTWSLAVDDVAVYWGDHNDGSVHRFLK